MKIQIKDKDVIVLDRGIHKDDDKSRYVVIENDLGEDIVNDEGSLTEKGKSITASVMDNEAIRHGATKIPASTCVDGGNIARYSDDIVSVYNANDKVMFVPDELAKLLIDHDLAVESK